MILEYKDTAYNPMQAVKRRFFALRNGILADTLRKAGSPYRYIFGLNLPQLMELSREIGRDTALADQLHANSTARCSRLLAPMIHEREDMPREKALLWLQQVLSHEEADVLCNQLIRHQPYAMELVDELAVSNDELPQYTALRLLASIQALQFEPLPHALPQSLLDSPYPSVRRLLQMMEL